jgi:hypothetical protein
MLVYRFFYHMFATNLRRNIFYKRVQRKDTYKNFTRNAFKKTEKRSCSQSTK